VTFIGPRQAWVVARVAIDEALNGARSRSSCAATEDVLRRKDTGHRAGRPSCPVGADFRIGGQVPDRRSKLRRKKLAATGRSSTWSPGAVREKSQVPSVVDAIETATEMTSMPRRLRASRLAVAAGMIHQRADEQHPRGSADRVRWSARRRARSRGSTVGR